MAFASHRIKKSVDGNGGGSVLGGTPVWWRGPGWKSSQASKPSRGPDAEDHSRSPNIDLVDRPVESE